MSVGKIAVRYAKALFEAAIELNKAESVRDDLVVILSIRQEVEEFNDLLESPVLNARKKKEIFTDLFDGRIDDLSLKFIFLLTDNKREIYLPAACRVYIDLYREREGIKSAVLTTAGDLEEASLIGLKKKLEDHYKCTIELETNTRADIIGGFVLKIDDQQLDASVSAQLRKIRKELGESVIS